MPAFLLACLAFVLPHARIVSGPEQHPGRARAVRSLPGLCKLPTGCGEGEATLVRVLSAAGFDREPQRVSELTAGFCNSVFLVELPSDARIGDETVVVVKLFSPLAKLRLRPSEVRAHAEANASSRRAHRQTSVGWRTRGGIATASHQHSLTCLTHPNLIPTARAWRPGRVRRWSGPAAAVQVRRRLDPRVHGRDARPD
jgi:hypothetical protein